MPVRMTRSSLVRNGSTPSLRRVQAHQAAAQALGVERSAEAVRAAAPSSTAAAQAARAAAQVDARPPWVAEEAPGLAP